MASVICVIGPAFSMASWSLPTTKVLWYHLRSPGQIKHMYKTRILLVDDHDIVRLGLMTLLNDQPDMEVVGEASTVGDGVKATEKLHLDVVLMDIRLPGEGGIEAAQQISKRFPSSRVVMLTSF